MRMLTLMLMLRKAQTKTTNLIRKTKHDYQSKKTNNNKAKTKYAKKNKGGSAFTAMGFFPNLPFLAKKQLGSLSPNLILI